MYIALILFIVALTVAVYKLVRARYAHHQQWLQLKPIAGPNSQHFLKDLYFTLARNGLPSEELFYPSSVALSYLFRKEGAFKLNLLTKNVVVICNARHLRGILSSSKNVSKSAEYDFLQDWIGDGLLTVGSKCWLQSRSLIAKIFHTTNLRRIMSSTNETIDEYVDSFVSGEYIDTQRTFHFTIDLIARSLLNTALEEGEQAVYLESIERLTKVFLARSVRPQCWPDLMFKASSLGRTYHAILRNVKTLTNQIIAKRKAQLAHGNTQQPEGKVTLLDLLLRTGLTEEQIAREVDTFIFAGHDTLAVTINWVLYFLGLYPEVTTLIRKEIKSVLTDDRAIDMEQTDSMVQLDSFIKECLRLYPPVPLIARLVEQEIRTEEFTLPTNTMLYILLEPIHRDEAIYPSPHTFQPNRFLDRTTAPFTYVPFSAGPRNCVAKRYAMALMKVLISKILLKYRIESVNGDPIDMTYSILQKPKHNLKIKLTSID